MDDIEVPYFSVKHLLRHEHQNISHHTDVDSNDFINSTLQAFGIWLMQGTPSSFANNANGSSDLPSLLAAHSKQPQRLHRGRVIFPKQLAQSLLPV